VTTGRVELGLPAEAAEIVDDYLATVARDAAQWVVADFGDPRLLAGSLAHELASGAARRTGATLLATGPLVGLVWVATYRTDGSNWLSNVVAVLSNAPVFQLVLLLAVPAAVVAMAGPGVPGRRLTPPPGLVPEAAIIATSAVVLGDATLIGTTLADARGVTALAVTAILVSAVRAFLAGVAMRRIVRLRAASC